MKEYKVVEIDRSATNCQIILNDFAADGWKIVGINEYWIFLEREAQTSVDEPEVITG